MKRTKVTRRLSLKAKFKSSDVVEVTITDEFNNVQVEQIPITLGSREDIEIHEENGTPQNPEDMDKEGDK